MYVKIKKSCPECKGTGKIIIEIDEVSGISKTCPVCKGKGYIIVEHTGVNEIYINEVWSTTEKRKNL